MSECVAPVQRALKALAKGRAPQCTFSGGAGGSNARIAWVPETVQPTSDAPETVIYVRVLEYRDAQGVTQRIKF